MAKNIKRPFVLFEVLIALSLMSILLTFLFSFLAQNMRVEQKMERARSAILERQNVQMRLQDLFTSLNRSSLNPTFYTQMFPHEETVSLVALFDNGIDPDPAFSGSLMGRLYLDDQKNLCLASWPLEEDKNLPWRKEILLTHISEMSYQFLGEKKDADPHFKPVTAAIGWSPSWPKERSDIPSIIRLSLRQGENSLQFAFRLPTSEPLITYRERGLKS